MHGSSGLEATALDFLKSRIDYERTWTVPYGQRDFRLDRMRELLARLGNPHQGPSIVHVAGTKGKGSTAATIESILRAAGYHTGLYSSPHLHRVEERLMVDGILCPPEELNELVATLQPAVAAMDAQPLDDERGSNRPTYFEVVTALAWLRFARHQVEVAVLEVGLGGRLDSTNVCQPRVSVITSISYDHTQQLGADLAAIAGEKAGIIKDGVPVVSGVLAPEARAVVGAVAAEHGCRLIQLGADFDFSYHPPLHLERADARGQMDYRRLTGDKFELPKLELSLLGEHQATNAAVALATVCELERQGWNIGEEAIRQGLVDVRWPARIEILRRHPVVVLDAAHNVASIEALVRVLDQSFDCPRRVAIFATTRDKDLRGMLEVLLPKFDDVIFTRYQNNPRGVDAESLEVLSAGIAGARRHLSADPAAAWKLAGEIASAEHLICITGSFFIAAEMSAAMRSG
jgi:dihydrofolate synthase / folylpolyglutamate synthase